MVAAFAWAYGETNRNISDRLLSVRVTAQKRAATRKQAAQRQPRKTQTKGKASSAKQAETADVAFEMPVISALLATRSEYFRRKLQQYQTLGDPLVVPVEPGEEELMKTLIKYMYTEELETTEEATILQLLLFAQKYVVDDCAQACANALSRAEKLSMTTVLQICELSDRQECSGVPDALVNRATDCLLETYGDLDAVWGNVTLRDAFLELPLSAVKVLLGHDKLHVKHENTAFMAVSWWVRHRPKERERDFYRLQPLLCWGKMTGAFLVAIFEEVPFLKNWSGASQLWNEVSRYRMVDPLGPSEKWNQLACRKDRQSHENKPSAHGMVECKVPISDLEALDGPGVGQKTVDLPSLVWVAGYAVCLQIQLKAESHDKSPSALGLYAMPHVPYGSADGITPSDSTPVIFGAKFTANKGHCETTSAFKRTELTEQDGWGYHNFFAARVQPDMTGKRNATQALRDAGFVCDGCLELKLDITMY